jgi:hypothetical protein
MMARTVLIVIRSLDSFALLWDAIRMRSRGSSRRLMGRGDRCGGNYSM